MAAGSAVRFWGRIVTLPPTNRHTLATGTVPMTEVQRSAVGDPAAAAARATPIPLWRWGVWGVLLLAAGLLFYFLLAPIWLGLRGAAWIAEFRARRKRRG
jgi:hypothetical protein